MSKGSRDYEAEYLRRKKLGASRGLSTAQSRGHARGQEVPVSTLKQQGLLKTPNPAAERRFYRVLKGIESGQSLSAAAKKAHISPVTVRKLDKDREVLKRDPATGRYQVTGYSEFDILTKDGKLFQGVVLDKVNASILGRYWNDVEKGLSSADPKVLKAYRRKVVYDVAGNRYPLLTSIDDVRAMFEQMTQGQIEDFGEKFYRTLRHAT